MPAELHLKIYELVLLPRVVRIPNELTVADADRTPAADPVLSKSCRRFYQETSPLLCCHTQFVFHVKNHAMTAKRPITSPKRASGIRSSSPTLSRLAGVITLSPLAI